MSGYGKALTRAQGRTPSVKSRFRAGRSNRGLDGQSVKTEKLPSISV
jgi:hypothetical protein